MKRTGSTLRLTVMAALGSFAQTTATTVTHDVALAGLAVPKPLSFT
jgi:hypothetical protein